jgi:hypothetical protein
MRVFAYIVNNEMLCPNCGKGKEGAQECQRKAYSFGHEVIGCYQCGETLNTPF